MNNGNVVKCHGTINCILAEFFVELNKIFPFKQRLLDNTQKSPLIIDCPSLIAGSLRNLYNLFSLFQLQHVLHRWAIYWFNFPRCNATVENNPRTSTLLFSLFRKGFLTRSSNCWLPCRSEFFRTIEYFPYSGGSFIARIFYYQMNFLLKKIKFILFNIPSKAFIHIKLLNLKIKCTFFLKKNLI